MISQSSLNKCSDIINITERLEDGGSFREVET